MGDLTRDSDRIIENARIVRDDNRTGGRHRREVSIGAGSAKIKKDIWVKRIRNIAIALFGIWVATGIAGLILDGIGFAGVMALVVASVIAIAVLGNYPKLKTPRRENLNKGNVRDMVGRTELWLESQRPALPPPAARIVSDMGVQLDALGLQLEGVDQNHPKAREVRSLVGEQLPEMIDSYRKIPAHLRAEQRAGATPDEQLTDSLGKISGEIDSITRQLAEGSLDDLAIKHRYLDYKFGEGAATAPELENKS
ncbi:hypothetical protein [Qipengyuania gelatinilytica]|uniref:5-bromo-4-chloroindolyl phosphate hydrolase n=1 Tax=Qipengyuania gelatinilytica TaxID=2867231 RepID=A0ABX9A4Q1_9SPHN|nr:hypothetical protein [Qipengyuania gelatinilytica]QZD96263.1 hypothetical protein K3136_06140 [Qipengyuania gelatinilytica]